MLMNMEISCLNKHCNILNLVRMQIDNGASMCSHIYIRMLSHIAHSNLVQSRKFHVIEMTVDNVYKLVMTLQPMSDEESHASIVKVVRILRLSFWVLGIGVFRLRFSFLKFKCRCVKV